MAKSLNRIEITGPVGFPPTLRRTKTGQAVANFSVAVGGKPGGKPEWFTIVAFDSASDALATFSVEHIRKGQRVYVEGRLQTHVYEDKEGHERTTLQIVASRISLLTLPTTEASAREEPIPF